MTSRLSFSQRQKKSWAGLVLGLGFFLSLAAKAVPLCQSLFTAPSVAQALQEPSLQRHLAWFTKSQRNSFDKTLRKISQRENLSEIQMQKLSRSILALAEAHSLTLKNIFTLDIHAARRQQLLGEVSSQAFLTELQNILRSQGLLRDPTKAEKIIGQLSRRSNKRALAIWAGLHGALNIASYSAVGSPLWGPLYLPGLKRHLTPEQRARLDFNIENIPSDIRRKVNMNLAYNMAIRIFNTILVIQFLDYLYSDIPEEINATRLAQINEQMDESTAILLDIMTRMNQDLIAGLEEKLAALSLTDESRGPIEAEIFRLKEEINNFRL